MLQLTCLIVLLFLCIFCYSVTIGISLPEINVSPLVWLLAVVVVALVAIILFPILLKLFLPLLSTGFSALRVIRLGWQGIRLFLRQLGKVGSKRRPHADRKNYEDYRRELRRTMQKPKAYDSDLHKIINRAYRSNAQIGSGSTADAIRYERLTGQPIKGKFHTQKGEQMVRQLEKWLKNHPTSDPLLNNAEDFARRLNDRQVAESILLDLKDALGVLP